MKLIIVAAHDPNLAIGKDGTLPWYYPEDLKFFKKNYNRLSCFDGQGGL